MTSSQNNNINNDNNKNDNAMWISTSVFITINTKKSNDIALILKQNQNYNDNDIILTNKDLLFNVNRGKTQIKNSPLLQILPSYRNAHDTTSTSVGTTYNNNIATLLLQEKIPYSKLIPLFIPSLTLLSAIITYFICDANGYDAIFPSKYTTHIVMKGAVWLFLLSIVGYEQAHFWYGSHDGGIGRNMIEKRDLIGLEIILYHENHNHNVHVQSTVMTSTTTPILQPLSIDTETTTTTTAIENENENDITTSKQQTETKQASTGTTPLKVDTKPVAVISKNETSTETPKETTSSTTPTPKPTPTKSSTAPTSPKPTASSPERRKMTQQAIPFRFIRATKGNVTEAKQRWADTCAWRQELGMDEILSQPHPKLQLIKENYPHYFHLRGKNNECCYYEKPPKMNLAELRKEGVVLEDLLKHYALCCEYMWTEIEASEEGKSIYVIDLEGMGIRDFAGEVVDFVKKASSFTAAHYPERSGSIYVINVPSWFSVIWNVVKPMVDDVTKKKIKIMRYGQEAITKALMEKIDIENIPPEYGGRSMPLGQSPEEQKFKAHFEKLNLMN